jgi:N-acetylmuramoyl-L-alanine amidase-like protein
MVAGSRMINTLLVLVGALTIGTITLMVIEAPPIHPEGRSLTAAGEPAPDPLEIVRQTEVPVQPMCWRNIVLHATGSSNGDTNAHFVVDRRAGSQGLRARATKLWSQQRQTRMFSGRNSTFNSNTICIALVGDFRSAAPPVDQYRDLLALVRALQFAFQISGGHVYLHSELAPETHSPGEAFPLQDFTSRLLRSH